ncbi:glutamate synthase alpha subunit domain protein [Ammonifex degensii KC4]|uniref:Glutamate synthase alpha subunit domain protein n=1 Tax=Ammonifex degensii (strain DSM 10501 / KC4) TaxID=429009 RepID=C9RBB0_AMMDK|nr:4Fe-4S dicluster domain-containing protein [Ammonifex degensii]ACX51537.1 glutamate synthase alpha subunit domain protein [Ammonifex degensii KC4]
MTEKVCRIVGMENGRRLDSRVLEEKIQAAVAAGYRHLEIEAYGQHGIGGRLWRAGEEKILVRIYGSPGQRVGAMGFPNTRIEVMGPASDDVGWLNVGAEIIVHGHAANGVGNAMAQGKIYVAGSIGARGMTMTKHNPRFDPPELWVLGSVGDYFAEFMAGGIAVICGYQPQNPENVLGFRPCVGMVGGKIFFRGPHQGISQADARIVPLGDADWEWLEANLRRFLENIQRPELYPLLARREEWQLIVALSPQERRSRPRRPMSDFREKVWDEELGEGGLLGDLIKVERQPIPVIATGKWRRFVPVWANHSYLPPCQAACPTGIPVAERWQLLREGKKEEALSLALYFTPFPATVCGYLCPNFCMRACTRKVGGLVPPDMKQLGKESLKASLPPLPPPTGRRVAVVGGGPAGIAAAWHLRLMGHEVRIFEKGELGGKLGHLKGEARQAMEADLARVRQVLPIDHREVQPEHLAELLKEYEAVVVATGKDGASLLGGRKIEPPIFAVGEVLAPAGIPALVGQGRQVAKIVAAWLSGSNPPEGPKPTLELRRVKLAYFHPDRTGFCTLEESASACASCGICRDCGICLNICPQQAITRHQEGNGWRYEADPQRCIGCGFCADACPCGVWELRPNQEPV